VEEWEISMQILWCFGVERLKRTPVPEVA